MRRYGLLVGLFVLFFLALKTHIHPELLHRHIGFNVFFNRNGWHQYAADMGLRAVSKLSQKSYQFIMS